MFSFRGLFLTYLGKAGPEAFRSPFGRFTISQLTLPHYTPWSRTVGS